MPDDEFEEIVDLPDLSDSENPKKLSLQWSPATATVRQRLYIGTNCAHPLDAQSEKSMSETLTP